MSYHHGLTTKFVDGDPPPIQVSDFSTIGLIGTALNGDINKPILINSLSQAIKVFTNDQQLPDAADNNNTIITALEAIFMQAPANVVVIRVAAENATSEKEKIFTTIEEEMTATEVAGKKRGIELFIEAAAKLGKKPGLLIAPYYSKDKNVAEKLNVITVKLRGYAFCDAPSDDKIAVLQHFGQYVKSSSLQPVTPQSVDVGRGNIGTSAVVAGLTVAVDLNNQGVHRNASNHLLKGVKTISHSYSYDIEIPGTDVDNLNEKGIASIVYEGGFRYWGARNLGVQASNDTVDKKLFYMSWRRVVNSVNQALLDNHLWAIDQNIDKAYISSILTNLKRFLRRLEGKAIIPGSRVWVDSGDNNIENILGGKATFRMAYHPYGVAEEIIFLQQLDNKLLTTV